MGKASTIRVIKDLKDLKDPIPLPNKKAAGIFRRIIIACFSANNRSVIRYPHLEYPQDMQVRHPFWYAMFSCPH